MRSTRHGATLGGPVKAAAATFTLAILPTLLGIQLFAGGLGASARDTVSAGACGDSTCELSDEAQGVVASLRRQGMDCRARPELTDHVVFAYDDGRVGVVDFGTSLTATARGTGLALRYCSPVDGRGVA